MRAYLAFTKKEFCELTRTYKLLIMSAVFLILGMMNPITAKITPMLLEKLMPEGIDIHLGDPTAIDSWVQFYKNVPQMGLIVLVIVFSGIMANEFTHDTLINMLTKGLPRRTVILSKFTMATSVWTAAYALCFSVSYAYTAYFWNSDNTFHIGFSAICLWIFGVLLISAIMLGGVLFKNSYGCLLFTGGVTVLLFLLNIVPKIAEYSPLALVSKNMALITNQAAVSDLTMPLILAGVCIVGMLSGAILLFDRKQI